MKHRLLSLALLCTVVAVAPLLAKPAPTIAAAIADPARTAKNRELDAARMPEIGRAHV